MSLAWLDGAAVNDDRGSVVADGGHETAGHVLVASEGGQTFNACILFEKAAATHPGMEILAS